jgi:hypothetical protein
MIMRTGRRYRSLVCTTEIIVVRPLAGDVALSCGGVEMSDVLLGRDANATPHPGFDGGTLLGKRYTDSSGLLEVLVTKAGTGSLALGEELLTIKESKPLPSSD